MRADPCDRCAPRRRGAGDPHREHLELRLGLVQRGGRFRVGAVEARRDPLQLRRLHRCLSWLRGAGDARGPERALQLAWSPWWLARFRFGPLEWLWRTLSYGRRQPMRVAWTKGQ
ncbi:MAG: DUF418 domain-containing protein [Gemmatimonadales bacterium]|nr:DUF418 domain-containing protein [Candidatus Palauibacter irciniicola]MYC19491.1 DUF418 domain-containing protein [Gemmatimonadales bacterium]